MLEPETTDWREAVVAAQEEENEALYALLIAAGAKPYEGGVTLGYGDSMHAVDIVLSVKISALTHGGERPHVELEPTHPLIEGSIEGFPSLFKLHRPEDEVIDRFVKALIAEIEKHEETGAPINSGFVEAITRRLRAQS